MNKNRNFVKANSLYLWSGHGGKVLETTPKKLLKMKTSATMDKARYFDCSGLVIYSRR